VTGSYADSHAEPGRGALYDERYDRGSEAFYWKRIEKPLLEELFARLGRRCASRGAEGASAAGPAAGRSRYLDFACGTGRILEVAAPHFAEAVGIDVSEPMLERARAKVPGARLIRANVLEETLDVGRFDVISLFRFLLNAEPTLRVAVLRWLRGVVAPGGRLVVNNHGNAWSAAGLIGRASDAVRGERRRAALRHREVVALLEGCGFRVVERHGFGVVPAVRNRTWLPAPVLVGVERAAAAVPGAAAIAKDCVYVAEPA